MNLKRAIIGGVLFWILIFFEVSLLMFGFNLDQTQFYYHIHYIFLIVFTAFLTKWYFRRKSKKGIKQGLLFGLIMLITATILDLIITIPFFIIPDGGTYTSFLFDQMLLIGELIVIITAGIVGGIKKKKK
jgi:peptidoglycan/LPS O-acetylase OafA/YrhL